MIATGLFVMSSLSYSIPTFSLASENSFCQTELNRHLARCERWNPSDWEYQVCRDTAYVIYNECNAR